MTTHAKGITEIQKWDEKPYQESAGGRKLTKATVTQAFTGDIEGDGVCDYLMAYPNENYSSYVGLQQVTGMIGGKQGSFVLQLTGTFDGKEASGTWFVVPASGTGDLKELSGQGTFRAPHGSKMDYTLDYEL
jgi:hypothetical protein